MIDYEKAFKRACESAALNRKALQECQRLLCPDIETCGDGEFKGSSIPGETVGKEKDMAKMSVVTPANKGKGQAIAFLRAHVAHTGEDCVFWPMAKDSDGYGIFGHEGRTQKAHRWMCIAAHGPAPTAEHHAAHSCGNGHLACINPCHLSWKTPAENGDDKRAHGTALGGTGRKLTVEQVRHILATKGVKTGGELAREYGVHRSRSSGLGTGAGPCSATTSAAGQSRFSAPLTSVH